MNLSDCTTYSLIRWPVLVDHYTYGNQQKTVVVPEDVPIVTLDPGVLSLLKPGVHIVLFFAADDKGQRIATRISAGKDGTVPPM